MTLLAQFAATGGGVANYIEDVFSCFLYTGTSATQTITNNIDLSTKGGMVWSKSRSAATAHTLYDTVRGATFEIQSNATSGQTTESNGLNQFNSNGYRIGPCCDVDWKCYSPHNCPEPWCCTGLHYCQAHRYHSRLGCLSPQSCKHTIPCS